MAPRSSAVDRVDRVSDKKVAAPGSPSNQHAVKNKQTTKEKCAEIMKKVGFYQNIEHGELNRPLNNASQPKCPTSQEWLW